MLKEACDIFKEIEAAKGKEKEVVVRNNKSNLLFRQMLYFLYNDMFTTGIAIKKIEKDIALEPSIDLANIQEAMKYIYQNNTGKDQVVANLQRFINSFDKNNDYHGFLISFFSKTYKCGITANTINKAFDKEFIPVFKVMLAHPLEKHASKIEGEHFYLTRKLDGHRMIAIVDLKKFKVSFYTRKGKPVLGLNELETDILNFVNINRLADISQFESGIVLDGEALLINPDNLPEAELFKQTTKELKKLSDKKNIVFHMFDCLSADEFKEGKSNDCYGDRRKWMEESEYTELVTLVEKIYEGSDPGVIPDFATEAVAKGWEGLMLNISKGLYETKRSSNLLKVKEFKYADVEVIGTYEGEKGKRLEGIMGGATVQFKDFTVDIGSGWSDEQRKQYTENPDELIGTIIEVRYFEETSNAKGGKGLRFPTLSRLRPDKTVEDISYES